MSLLPRQSGPFNGATAFSITPWPGGASASGTPLRALGRAGPLVHLHSIRRWAAKPIISRRKVASADFSSRPRRAIVSSVIVVGLRLGVAGLSNPTLAGTTAMAAAPGAPL